MRWDGMRCMYDVLTLSLCVEGEGMLDYIRGF